MNGVALAKGQDFFANFRITDTDGNSYPDGSYVRVYVDDALAGVANVRDGRVEWLYRGKRSGQHDVTFKVDTIEGTKAIGVRSVEPGRYEVCAPDAQRV
jgi:hypothetical protein